MKHGKQKVSSPLVGPSCDTQNLVLSELSLLNPSQNFENKIQGLQYIGARLQYIGAPSSSWLPGGSSHGTLWTLLVSWFCHHHKGGPRIKPRLEIGERKFGIFALLMKYLTGAGILKKEKINLVLRMRSVLWNVFFAKWPMKCKICYQKPLTKRQYFMHFIFRNPM